MVYMGHRRYLPLKHPLRKMKHLFDGMTEKRLPPRHNSGKEVYDQVKNINVVLGKRKRSPPNDENGVWHKKSILWELPYWSELDVRHSIDVMHVEKNVCESLLGTLLNMPGKSKDHKNARADLKEMGIRPELHPVEMDTETELPTTCITLSKKEKKEFCEFLKSVKVSSRYSTNVSKLVSLPDLKIAPGVKSHDYHVLLTQMIAVGIQNPTGECSGGHYEPLLFSLMQLVKKY